MILLFRWKVFEGIGNMIFNKRFYGGKLATWSLVFEEKVLLGKFGNMILLLDERFHWGNRQYDSAFWIKGFVREKKVLQFYWINKRSYERNCQHDYAF